MYTVCWAQLLTGREGAKWTEREGQAGWSSARSSVSLVLQHTGLGSQRSIQITLHLVMAPTKDRHRFDTSPLYDSVCPQTATSAAAARPPIGTPARRLEAVVISCHLASQRNAMSSQDTSLKQCIDTRASAAQRLRGSESCAIILILEVIAQVTRGSDPQAGSHSPQRRRSFFEPYCVQIISDKI